MLSSHMAVMFVVPRGASGCSWTCRESVNIGMQCIGGGAVVAAARCGAALYPRCAPQCGGAQVQ